MPFPVFGSNSAVAGYLINNSLRLDSASSNCGLSRFGNNSRNGNTFTISFWVKRCNIGARSQLVNSKVEDSGVNSMYMEFRSDDKISVIGQPASGSGAGSNRTVLQTNAVFRDPSAWYHIVYRQDTTQSTASDRHRLYVNGIEQSLQTNDALDQNVAFAYWYNASSYPYNIGNDERDNIYADIYMAEHHYTDGVSNAPTEFGETNENGVWIPKEYTGSHGSYGHYLKFDNSDGGSGTTSIGGHSFTTGSSSTIGADSSGNGNHFHIQGYDTVDQTTDTPTNNFCTLNPLDNKSGDTYSEGNTGIATVDSGDSPSRSTFSLTNGKWYWEVKRTSAGSPDLSLGVMEQSEAFADLLGSTAKGYGYYSANGNKYNNGSNSSYGNSYTNGDIIGIALDMDNGVIWFSKNGTWQNSATQAEIEAGTTTNSAFTGISGTISPAISDGGTGSSTAQFNFGKPPFSISSGNSDANGYGNFEYAVPSGYYALCTKNLAEYG